MVAAGPLLPVACHHSLSGGLACSGAGQGAAPASATNTGPGH